MWKLFLDDLRDPPDQSWIVCRTYEDAVLAVKRFGFPSEVSFDHDLGYERTGMDLARYLVELDLDQNTMPDHFSFNVHSANPVGAENIEALLGRYVRFKRGF